MGPRTHRRALGLAKGPGDLQTGSQTNLWTHRCSQKLTGPGNHRRTRKLTAGPKDQWRLLAGAEEHVHPLAKMRKKKTNQLVGAMEGERMTLECLSEAFPKSINYWTRESGDIISQ
ncbi:unnamed protein product, partial [Nesidiocoris tenuis]